MDLDELDVVEWYDIDADGFKVVVVLILEVVCIG